MRQEGEASILKARLLKKAAERPEGYYEAFVSVAIRIERAGTPYESLILTAEDYDALCRRFSGEGAHSLRMKSAARNAEAIASFIAQQSKRIFASESHNGYFDDDADVEALRRSYWESIDSLPRDGSCNVGCATGKAQRKTVKALTALAEKRVLTSADG